MSNFKNIADYSKFDKELKEYANLLNSSILNEITSKQNKILELFNNMHSKKSTKNKKSTTNDDEYANKINLELLKKITDIDIKKLMREELKDLRNSIYHELNLLQDEEFLDENKITEIISLIMLIII